MNIKKSKKLGLICLLVLLALLLAGCTKSIEEIKNDEYIGKSVSVSGNVTISIKIGELSGFRLEDQQGNSILVHSEELPAEGDIIIVKGTLIKDSLFGYYIQAERIT